MNISPAQIRYHENGQESRLGTQRNSSNWGVVPPDMKGLVLYHNSLLLARTKAHELTGRFNHMVKTSTWIHAFCFRMGRDGHHPHPVSERLSRHRRTVATKYITITIITRAREGRLAGAIFR